MRKLLLTIAMVLASASASLAGGTCGGDPAWQTAQVSISSATTTSIVAPASIGTNNRNIAVCAWALSATGTSPTFQFVEGTGSTCGTNQANVSGAYAASLGIASSSGALLKTATAGDRLCIVTTGTPVVGGFVDYVVVP